MYKLVDGELVELTQHDLDVLEEANANTPEPIRQEDINAKAEAYDILMGGAP